MICYFCERRNDSEVYKIDRQYFYSFPFFWSFFEVDTDLVLLPEMIKGVKCKFRHPVVNF